MYTSQQLCSEFNLPCRRLRYWTVRGVLSPPLGGRGPNAYYTDRHIRQIRAIIRAQEARVTLADLAQRHHATP